MNERVGERTYANSRRMIINKGVVTVLTTIAEASAKVCINEENIGNPVELTAVLAAAAEEG
jgi:hypothetical protein